MRLVQVSVAALAAICAAPLAAAQQADQANSPLGEVYACASKTDNAERLACYDAAVGRLQASETRGDVVAIDRAQAARVEREAFGFSLPSLPNLFGRHAPAAAAEPTPAAAPAPSPPSVSGETSAAAAAPPVAPGELNEVSVVIERVSDRARHAVFYLSNGQVWVQIDTDSVRRIRGGEQAVIRRAAMGSFLLHFEDGGRAVRVRREQ